MNTTPAGPLLVAGQALQIEHTCMDTTVARWPCGCFGSGPDVTTAVRRALLRHAEHLESNPKKRVRQGAKALREMAGSWVNCTVAGQPCHELERHRTAPATCQRCGQVVPMEAYPKPPTLAAREHSLPWTRLAAHLAPSGEPCLPPKAGTAWIDGGASPGPAGPARRTGRR